MKEKQFDCSRDTTCFKKITNSIKTWVLCIEGSQFDAACCCEKDLEIVRI